MAIIYTYPTIGTPEDPDIMLISDVSLSSNATRNITLSKLATFINSKVDLVFLGDAGAGIVNLSTQTLFVEGTANQIETAATNQTIQIGLPSALIVPGTMNVVGSTELLGALTVEGVSTFNDDIEVNNNATFYSSTTFEDTANFQLAVTDLTGSAGTAGQLLSSTGTNVQWIDNPATGTVTGTGTTNTLPIWSDGPNGVLGDSQIAQTKIDGGTIFDLNAVTTTTYTPAINTKLLDLNSGGNKKFSITQDGGGGVILPAGGGTTNPGPSFNLGGTAFSNGENALSVGAATTAFGNGSFAANFITLASGGGSSAFGLLTESSALASAAFGNKSVASGNYSIAAGQDSIASGQSSVAIGEKGEANGKNSFVQGFGGTAAGNNAAKFGYAGSADGNNAVKFGYESIASGNNSFASGWQTTASGLYSFTAGDGNIASGERTAAFGVDNNVSGKGSFAIGARNTVPSENSFVGGTDNTLIGSSGGVPGAGTSLVFGYQNTAEGTYSTVLGTNNDTGASTGANPNNYITLIGHSNNNTLGNRSTLIGHLNINTLSQNSYVIGDFNLNQLGSNNYIFGRNNDMDSCTNSAIIGTVNEIEGDSGTPNITLVGVGLKFDSSGPNTGYGRATYVGVYNDETDSYSQFQIGNGTNALNRKNALSINKDSEIKISEYGSGTVTGTATRNLSVAADGKIIETENPYKPDYLSFVCLLSQSGATNPQPNIVLENSLGIPTPFTAFTRVSSGEYNLSATGKFKLLKTIVFINGGSAENNHDVAWEVIDADNLRIRTHNSDGKLTKASLEIRTYN